MPSQLTPQQMQDLVAPIALYPDSLIAQILAASAYPTQIVEADRFLQQNPNLQGQALGQAVDQQDWDPSVKALTQTPTVLSDMDKNLSWTSELGDANYNQPQDLQAAVQFMRHKAQQAGTLQSTPQQTVQDQGNDIDIQPANPDVVYVPEYNPEYCYGYPVAMWPGFDPWWGGITGPYLSFGIGFGIAPFFGFGWGWPAWGFHWGYGGGPWFHGGFYRYRNPAFYNRNAFYHGDYRGFGHGFAGGFARGDRGLRGYENGGRGFGRPGVARPGGGFGRPGGGRVGGGAQPNRGFARPGGGNARPGGGFARPPARPGAFGSIRSGGTSRGFSARGRSSFGGGMRMGGGFRGGGARGGRPR
jgi:hypothetical protein